MTSGPERATLFLDGVAGVRREIVTPEGVAMPVELANIGERGSAFVIDLFLWLGVTIFLYLMLALSLLQGIGGNVARTVILFIAFVVRNLYFVYFELAWQGATPGKRIIGLRVIDRRGGPLLPGAVIARNLTREIEAFLPLSLLLSLDPAHATADTWEMLTLGLWLLLFSALPFCNRDRMRGGDLIAGTMVISLPRRILLQDLAAAEPRRQVFTEKQLRLYGAFELQILEELLRRPPSPDTTRLRREVCDRICRKIAWPSAVADQDVERFLNDFYSAERAYLEREQLFGRPHADKHDHAAPER